MESFIPDLDLRLDFSKAENIYIATSPADLRKGIDGYVSIVQTSLQQDPTDGSVYLFTNRMKNKVKGIIYDKGSFWMVYCRSGKLKWPDSPNEGDFYRISQSQLSSLMAGLGIVPNVSVKSSTPYF